MDRVPVVLNLRAGGVDDPTEAVRDAFERYGIAADIKPHDREDPTAFVKRQADAGAPLVVVGGGDGSLHAAAGALAGSETALGILPVGTFNHFAKDLGIPLDVDQAVAVIAAGVTKRVDVGEANGHVFVNNASVGIYPKMIRLREGMRESLGHGKWTAYAIAVWRTLTRYRLLHVRVGIDGQTLVRKTPFVFIGNNSYAMERLEVGRRVAVDAGVLSLHMARCEGPLRFVRLVLRAFTGSLGRAPELEHFTTEEILVETRRRHELVGFDGEVVPVDMPLRCRIRPGALRVVVPAGAA